MVQAFDADGDNTLTPREKAVLITSVATFPDAAANRFILHAGIRGAIQLTQKISGQFPGQNSGKLLRVLVYALK